MGILCHLLYQPEASSCSFLFQLAVKKKPNRSTESFAFFFFERASLFQTFSTASLPDGCIINPTGSGNARLPSSTLTLHYWRRTTGWASVCVIYMWVYLANTLRLCTWTTQKWDRCKRQWRAKILANLQHSADLKNAPLKAVPPLPTQLSVKVGTRVSQMDRCQEKMALHLYWHLRWLLCLHESESRCYRNTGISRSANISSSSVLHEGGVGRAGGELLSPSPTAATAKGRWRRASAALRCFFFVCLPFFSVR